MAHRGARTEKGQRGIVMLVIMLLILMFTGLGLLAMRHTQGELRAAGAYQDAAQASDAAEAAIALAATDMRLNFDRINSTGCANYANQFTQATTEVDIPISFSEVFDDGSCNTSRVPVAGLNGGAIARTAQLANMRALVVATQDRPSIAPKPPGYSTSSDDPRTYEWYYFSVKTDAQVGQGDILTVDTDDLASRMYAAGHATARARMVIGPLPRF